MALRVLSTTQEVEVWSLLDPAIATPLPATRECYQRSLSVQWLQLIPGRTPTRFFVGALGNDVVEAIEDEAQAQANARGLSAFRHSQALYQILFRAGTRRIEGLGEHTIHIASSAGRWIMSDAVSAQVPLSTQREIGGYVLQLCSGAATLEGPRAPEPEPDPGFVDDAAQASPEPDAPTEPDGEPSTDLGKS